MARPKKKKQTGRPTLYTPKIGFDICMRMADGESVRSICRDDKMPCRKTINNWLLMTDNEEFLRQYETAETLRAETLFDEILEIADDSSNDWIERETNGGNIIKVANSGNIQRARLMIDVRKWALSKMLPKKYGNRIHQDHTVESTHESFIELLARFDKEGKEKATNGTA